MISRSRTTLTDGIGAPAFSASASARVGRLALGAGPSRAAGATGTARTSAAGEDVPATATLVAVLLGGASLGIVGALLAIPVAAAVRLLLG